MFSQSNFSSNDGFTNGFWHHSVWGSHIKVSQELLHPTMVLSTHVQKALAPQQGVKPRALGPSVNLYPD